MEIFLIISIVSLITGFAIGISFPLLPFKNKGGRVHRPHPKLEGKIREEFKRELVKHANPEFLSQDEPVYLVDLENGTKERIN